MPRVLCKSHHGNGVFAPHSCILGVNNWATDFCTRLQFYNTKTWKMDELWRLALISLGWYCKMWLLVKQCRKKNLESHFWPFLEKIKLPRGNFGYILSSYFIWEERCAKIFWIHVAFSTTLENPSLQQQVFVAFW